MTRSDTGTWRVVDAAFESSAPDIASGPGEGVPEVAITGRSNVGKSSLLNALVGRRGLARVSSTPGRTRLLNFFSLRVRGPDGREHAMRLVDLPGYGFARAHASERETFGPMVEGYLRTRRTLVGLLLLVDARRGPTPADIDLLEFTSAKEAGANGPIPVLLCATKCDKLGAAERGLVTRRFADALGIAPHDVLLTSATTRVGLDGDGLTRELGLLIASDE